MDPLRPSPDGLPSAGSPDAVEALKSGAGRKLEVPLEPPKVPIADLPWSYDDDRVVLLARDPRTLFAYWDMHPDTVAAATKELGDAKAFLRLELVANDESELLRELDVDLGWRGFYLYDCTPNRDYRVELVMKASDGRVRSLGRSTKPTSLPQNQPSAYVDDRFEKLDPAGALPEGGIRGAPAIEAASLHKRSFDLSAGEAAVAEGDEATSSRKTVQGLGGRAWSGTIRK